jgi:hypothetical protein
MVISRLGRSFGFVFLSALFAATGTAQPTSALNELPTTTQSPDAFGTQDYTVTTIPAVSFSPSTDNNGVTTYLTRTPTSFEERAASRMIVTSTPGWRFPRAS